MRVNNTIEDNVVYQEQLQRKPKNVKHSREKRNALEPENEVPYAAGFDGTFDLTADVST